MTPPVLLDPDESPARHPCAAARLYESDLALLSYLLQDLRALVRQAAAGQVELVPHDQIVWEVHGLRRRTVICDPDRIVEPVDFQVVGFFGDRRTESDDAAIDDVEVGLLDEFRSYTGILSYSSVELVNDQWANLVVHAEPDDREAWRGSRRHVDAVDRIAPAAYHSVRIHNGCLPDGVIGPKTVVVETTKYWDYDADPVWHATRTLPGGATETIDSPKADLQ